MATDKLTPVLIFLTLFCLTVFACNSIFCRAALIGCGMGPLQYTAVRSLSAAAILAILCCVRIIRPLEEHGSVWRDALKESSWSGGMSLFAYMVCFSLGYVSIPAGAGTLVINLCVQFCMIGYGIMHGLYPKRKQYLGLAVATFGLFVLLLPGLTAPPLLSALLMAATGFAWGVFTVCGRGAHSAALATAGNFWRASVLGFVCLASFFLAGEPTSTAALGFALAGGLASSLGYILWYAIVPRYSLINASIIQLAVPIITALLGALFLAEAITLRLVVATVFIVGGIGVALKAGTHPHAKRRQG